MKQKFDIFDYFYFYDLFITFIISFWTIWNLSLFSCDLSMPLSSRCIFLLSIAMNLSCSLTILVSLSSLSHLLLLVQKCFLTGLSSHEYCFEGSKKHSLNLLSDFWLLLSAISSLFCFDWLHLLEIFPFARYCQRYLKSANMFGQVHLW